MINENPDAFILGPPKVPNKTYNAPRDSYVHNMTPRIELYAKKLRQVYIRTGTIASVKQFADPLRVRQETDRIEECMKKNQVCGVINARDEFDDVDLVWPARIPTRIINADHPWVQPWYVRHPETEEEIRVTCQKIERHMKTNQAFFLDF